MESMISTSSYYKGMISFPLVVIDFQIMRSKGEDVMDWRMMVVIIGHRFALSH
jgi:hypothetical protein